MAEKPQVNKLKERLIFLSPKVQKGIEKESSTRDFESLGSLGQGAFGRVFKVRCKENKQIYAIKQISKKQIKEQEMVDQIKTEIKIMYSLNHPNIIKLYSHFEEEDYIYLILEFAAGGQLWQNMRKQGGRFPEQVVKSYIADLIAALEYLHNLDPPIIHRDIKPENLLLDSNQRVKLADFGWSNFFTDKKRMTYCGTLEYLAPEMIMNSGHDQSLDVWTLGVLIYELLVGMAPFTPPRDIKDPEMAQKALEDNIMKGKILYPKDFPQIARDLISRMLKKEPKLRITIADIKKHPWLSEEFSSQKDKPQSNLNHSISEEEYKSLKQKNEELNGSINNMKQQLQEFQIQIKKKNDQMSQQRQQYEKIMSENGLQSSINLTKDIVTPSDIRNFQVLEDEKEELKRQNEELWQKLKDKDNELSMQINEIKKNEELKKDIQRHKLEKKNLNERVQRYQEELDSKDQIINQQNQKIQEQKIKYEIKQKQIQIQGGSGGDNEEDKNFLAEELNEILQEVKLKLQSYEKAADEYDDFRMQIYELEKQVHELSNLRDLAIKERVSQVEDELGLEFEQQKQKYEDQIRELQEQIQSVQTERKEFNEFGYNDDKKKGQNDEALARELEHEKIINRDMKIDWEQMKKLKVKNEEKIKDQSMQIKELKEIVKILEKKVEKAQI